MQMPHKQYSLMELAQPHYVAKILDHGEETGVTSLSQLQAHRVVWMLNQHDSLVLALSWALMRIDYSEVDKGEKYEYARAVLAAATGQKT